MPDVLVLAVALALAGATAGLRDLRPSVALAMATWLVVPAPLVVPNPLSSAITLHRLVLVGLLVAVVRARARHGELPGQFNDRFWMVVASLAVFVAYVTAFGTAGAEVGPAALLTGAAKWFDHLATFLVVGVAAARLRDPRFWLRLGIVLGLLIAGIAALEFVTGRAWGAWLFADLGSLQHLDAAADLQVRAGQVRVRAGSEFALEFAWVALALWPFALMGLDEHRRGEAGAVVWRTVALVAAILLPLAVLATQTRSAIGALPVVVVVWSLLARPRPLVWRSAAIVLGLVVVTAIAAPTFDVATDPGSVDVRDARIEQLTGIVVEQPWTGLGLGGVEALGMPTTDGLFVRTYGEVGVVGLAILAAVLVLAMTALAPAIFSMSSAGDRRLAVACLLGAMVMVVAGTAYDSLSLLGSARVFWSLVAVGAVTCAPFVGDESRPWTRRRVVVAAVVVVVGVAMPWLAPQTAAVEGRFSTLPIDLEGPGTGDPVVPYGRAYTATVCAILDHTSEAEADLDGRCRDAAGAAGWGRFRLSGTDLSTVDAGVARVSDAITSSRAVPELRLFVDRRLGPRPATWALTAPVWSLFLAAVLLVLPRERRPVVPRPQAREHATV